MKLDRVLQWLIVAFLLLFILFPLLKILLTTLTGNQESAFHLFSQLVSDKVWQRSFMNSCLYAGLASLIATVLATILAYGQHYTEGFRWLKQGCRLLILLPMFLPTITYGFVLMYTFGRQGLLSHLLGHEVFNIYGKNGLIIGFVIYVLPIAFLLVEDAMTYLDRRQVIVSRLMGDSPLRRLFVTVIQPLKRTFIVAFVQTFFMSFTDFGLPASVAGRVDLITTQLYGEFLGALPNFPKGAMIAITMLTPSIISILVLRFIKTKPTHFTKFQGEFLAKSKRRDVFHAVFMTLIATFITAVFLVMLVIPFVTSYPYQMNFTFVHFKTFFADSSLILTLTNSVKIALCTAVFGTGIAYLCGNFVTRHLKDSIVSRIIDSLANVTSSISGMVLGVGYMLLFVGTSLQGSLIIIIVANIVHYFATPYQLAKAASQKLDSNWEHVGQLMGDSWLKTLRRILIPNSLSTMIEMLSYYFINSMVTISAVLFLTSADTMLITTKIAELQHFQRYPEVFILSILLLVINLGVKLIATTTKRSVLKNENKIKSNDGIISRWFISWRNGVW
jgi:iron(III) transport system permease protein